MEQVIQMFASAVYEDAFELGFHAVVVGIRGEKRDAGIETRRCASVDAVVTAAEGLANQGFNVYYPLTLIRAECVLQAGARGTEDEVAALLGLHVDMDLRGPAHPNATIPDVGVATAILDAFAVPPTFVIFTGHGVQATWLFKEPMVIESDSDRRRAKLLVRRHIATIAAIARMEGGHAIDATGDLARVLRMPGTLNRKAREGVALPVVATQILRPEGPLDGNVPRYNPEDIEPLLVWLDDGEQDIDYSLVGSFDVNRSAAAPAIVERLCGRSTAFAQLWNHDPKASLTDKSTSGYRYAMMGHLVRAGATDQDLVDAVCAWYGTHDPNYDKHLRRPELIAHEIAKQHTRQQNRQSKAEGDPSAPALVPPSVEGPCGIRLVAIESKPTAAKRRVRFEVYVDGQSAGEILATDAGDAGRRVADQLDKVVEDARGALPKLQSEEIHKWLRGIVTAKQLNRIAEDLRKYQENSQASNLMPFKPTVHDITVRYMRESLCLAFREPGDLVWSEKRGQSLSRNDILNLFPQELLEKIKAAGNYPTPTVANTTKHIHHLQLELKSVWTTIIMGLPTETEAQGLGPDSKAAARLCDLICRIWETPEIWAKAVTTGPDGRLIDRMSLALRARELAADTHCRSRWVRIYRGADAFIRTDPGASGDTVSLAMRATLCRGAINRIVIPGVVNQRDLKILMDRYGLRDQGTVPDRLHRTDGQQHICVLSRQLTDRFISGVDGDEEGRPVTKPPVSSVTRGGAELEPIHQCAEVAHEV